MIKDKIKHGVFDGGANLGKVSLLVLENGVWQTLYVSTTGTSNTYGVFIEGNKNVIIDGPRVAIGGVTSPTALLELAAGTVNLAPFKLNAGANKNISQAGEWEYNGTNLFFNRNTLREGVLTQSAVTTEVVIANTTVTVNIGGINYKLLAQV